MLLLLLLLLTLFSFAAIIDTTDNTKVTANTRTVSDTVSVAMAIYDNVCVILVAIVDVGATSVDATADDAINDNITVVTAGSAPVCFRY